MNSLMNVERLCKYYYTLRFRTECSNWNWKHFGTRERIRNTFEPNLHRPLKQRRKKLAKFTFVSVSLSAQTCADPKVNQLYCIIPPFFSTLLHRYFMTILNNIPKFDVSIPERLSAECLFAVAFDHHSLIPCYRKDTINLAPCLSFEQNPRFSFHLVVAFTGDAIVYRSSGIPEHKVIHKLCSNPRVMEILSFVCIVWSTFFGHTFLTGFLNIPVVKFCYRKWCLEESVDISWTLQKTKWDKHTYFLMTLNTLRGLDQNPRDRFVCDREMLHCAVKSRTSKPDKISFWSLSGFCLRLYFMGHFVSFPINWQLRGMHSASVMDRGRKHATELLPCD